MLTKNIARLAAVVLLLGSLSTQGAFAGSGKECATKKKCPAVGDHMTTCKAMGKAGMCGVVKKGHAVTIFAPTDAAWNKMPKAKRDALMADRKQLRKVLSYHVVPRKLSTEDLQSMRSAKTMQGEFVMINNKDGSILIDGAIVQGPESKFRNATVFEIDEVLVPERGK